MPRGGATIAEQDRKWRQESDAKTLAEAEVIKSTPSRLSGAKKAAKRIAEEERKQAEAMTRIATGKKDTGADKSGGEKSKKRTTQKRQKPKNQFNIGQKI
jgi:hypothetical protein